MVSDTRLNRETTETNLLRLYYLSLVGMPVSLVHILAFTYFVAADSNAEILWRSAIIVIHIVQMMILAAYALLSSYMRKMEQPSIMMMVTLQYVMTILILVLGVVTATADQLVTSSITPFLVACTITGLFILIPAWGSIPVFLAAYVLFSSALGWMQSDTAILASNQVNGITAVGLGTCLSIVLWNSHTKSFHQRECIEQQKRELETANEKLFHLAAYDSLTGLLNRREFEKRVELELANMRRYDYVSSIILLDIDYFKHANDKYGHPAGDSLLKQFSQILENALREIDLVARWGGEEFIALLPAASGDDGGLAAERVRKAVENHRFRVGSNSIKLTVSIGGAELLNQGENPFHEAYQRADKAVYSAKDNGRNCVVFADKDEDKRLAKS